MVEVRKIQIQDQHFIGISLNLPQYPIHFIISTHAILATDSLSIQHFEDEQKHTAVVLCRYLYGFDGLLSSEVVAMNAAAIEKGVAVGMNAKEALMLCEENKKAKREEA